MIELTGIANEPILIPEWQRIALVIDYGDHRTVYAGVETLSVSDTYEEIVQKIEDVR